MDIIGFIIIGFLAVMAMTFFSFIWGQLIQRSFGEPGLIARILQHSKDQGLLYRHIHLWGWVIHLGLGYIFLGSYELLWWVTGWERDLLLSIPIGFVSGLIGVIGWKAMFTIVDYKPQFNNTHYYIHLVFAHVVFSVVAVGLFLNFRTGGLI